MKKNTLLMGLLCLLLSTQIFAQAIEQTVRGTIVDAESKMELIGAKVKIITQGESLGTSSNIDGSFKIENVPVGRNDIEVTYLGYEPIMMFSVMINSGKELVLNLEMEESSETLETVEISAESAIDKTKALNGFAAVSSRTFSVEETSRYAAASYDPARMAQNYAGVSIGAGSDLYNEIVIRGNSPGGVLWRLEGIEIPNPNHFGSMGNSGGAISMLSSSTLNNSDFYTGAFPAEFGNATSGIFDLNMRSGNNEKRESAIMVGALGVEVATEGPFSKKGKASYLFNYRYSTLALLQASGINPVGDVLPTYQDLSFKVNVPTTSAGTFALFGLAGDNLAAGNPAQDSTAWVYRYDNEGFAQKIGMATLGLSHRYLVDDQSYIRTVAIVSGEKENEIGFYLDNKYNEVKNFDQKITQKTFRISSLYHRKVNAKLNFRFGGIYSFKDFQLGIDDLINENTSLESIFSGEGSSALIQLYAQTKYKFTEDINMNFGVHYTQIGLNNKFSIEPRFALSYGFGSGNEISFASGLHSRMEHLSLYTLKGTHPDIEGIQEKRDLGLTKSWHNVVAFDKVFSPKLRVKTEVYYQHLFNIPIINDVNSTFTPLNAFDMWDFFGLPELVQEGTGRNIGIDVTIERFFADNYYFLITGSLYDSKYKNLDGNFYNTRFNGNYQLNLLAGKEWIVGKNNNILGLNGKTILSGGARYTPINLPASMEQGYQINFSDRPYEEKTTPYYRMDLGVSYKINKAKVTHTIMFDIQNVTNRQNLYELYYSENSQQLESETQTGLFPFINYRLEF